MTGCGDETLGLPEVTRAALVSRLALPNGGPDGVRAVREITRRALPETRGVLERLVTETPNLTPAKAAAIRALGARPDPEAEAFLVSRLPAASPAEVGQIARALARTGSTAALAPLSSVTVPEGSRAAGAVLAARRFIAFRAGQTGAEIERSRLPDPLPLAPAKARRIEQRVLSTETLADAAPAIRAAVPEIALDTDTALELTCKGATLWLVPVARLADPETVARAGREPGIAFVLLTRDRCIGGVFFDSYVLSQPEEDGVIGLYVARLSGEITLAGRADASDDGVTFRLDALNIRRNPGAVTIAGRLTASGALDLSEAVSGIGRAVGQVPPRRPARAAEEPI